MEPTRTKLDDYTIQETIAQEPIVRTYNLSDLLAQKDELQARMDDVDMKIAKCQELGVVEMPTQEQVSPRITRSITN